jgi:hypothetical protein
MIVCLAFVGKGRKIETNKDFFSHELSPFLGGG